MMTYDEAQEIHEQLQERDPEHDRGSCVCCCAEPECDLLMDEVGPP